MDERWTTLGLEATKDVSAIKRAYAEKAKACHPEEDPEGFLKLRQAYQAALAYAEGGEEPLPPGPEAAEAENEGWTLTDGPAVIDEGPNPFADHPAAVAFRDLYTGKRRKDPQAWMDYFTSGDFLDVAWERRFAGLLLEEAARLEGEYPIPREFLTWLCAAYRFAVDRAVYRDWDSGNERTEFSFRIDQDAQFEGQEFLFQLAARGPAVKPLKGAEQAVSRSIADYRALVRLAEEDRWTEETLKKAGNILDFYRIGNFQDRNPAPPERHPAGMRLINHFFRREKLPRELYQMAWEKMELKTALMGRARLLYGDLRARVLEQVPDIAEGELDIRQLNKELEAFRQRVRALEESGKPEDWEQAGAAVKAFFNRPDFQKALLNRKFAEEHMKYHVQWAGECFAREILDYYGRNPDAPCAKQLTELMAATGRRRMIQNRNRKDANAPAAKETLTLTNRPFFRYWLNTGFYHSMDRETKQPLLGYLNQELPYLPEWSRKLLGVKDEETPEPVSVTLKLGKDLFTVQFHLRYMSFLRNGEPVRRPCLIWDQLMEWAPNTDTFLRLLPITAADYNQYETVKSEILRRLEDTAAPEEGRAFIAACLADQVCGLPIPDAVGMEDAEEPEWVRSLPPVSFLPYQIFSENTEVLYVCIWFQRDRVLALFQQTPFGQKLMEKFEDVRDTQAAEALAKQLLEDQLHPKGFPMEALKVLPEAVYAQWDYAVRSKDKDLPPLWSTPVELHGEAVTAEELEELLTLFSTGRVERLEWSWKCAFPVDEPPMDYEPRRSLVLMKSGGRYVCLYFDDFCAESYALLEKPEVYGQDKNVPQAVPFRQSKLFPNVLHRNFFTIRRHLEKIFSQVSWPNNVKPMAGRIWNYAVNVDHGRVKYNLDKQLLGGFPMERAHNRPDALFYFYEYPSYAARVDDGGSVETLAVTEGNRPKVQKLLADFLLGGSQKLRLTWGKTAGERWHIVLRQDSGRFLLAWVREDKKTAEFHAADKWTYMDVEGKKYPKDSFLGKVTPAYLIHDLPALRNALDLLLANLNQPERVTSPIGEYAWEKPGKPRPYEALRAELVDGME